MNICSFPFLLLLFSLPRFVIIVILLLFLLYVYICVYMAYWAFVAAAVVVAIGRLYLCSEAPRK